MEANIPRTIIYVKTNVYTDDTDVYTDKNIKYRKEYELYQTSLQPLSNHFDSWAIHMTAFYLFVNSTVLKQIPGKL